MCRSFLSVAMLMLTAMPLLAEDWPGWLGPRRDGTSEEKVPPWKGELKVLWKQPVGEGHGSPVVAGGKVFLHTKVKDKNAESLSAFDLRTGKPAWSQTYEHVPFKSLFGNGPRGTPSVVDGKVYTFGITGVLTCFDAKDGRVIWQVDTLKKYGAKNLFFGMSCSPLVDGDRVYVNVGGKGASLVAVNKDTGEPAWQSLDDKASYSSPVMIEQAGKKRLVFLTGANLVAVEPATGKAVWSYPFKDALSESSTTPVRVGDILFGSSITLGGIGLRLQGDEVERVWAEPALTCYFSTPVVAGKELYVVTGTKPPALVTRATLRCIDPATGMELWKRDNVGKYHSSLVRTGDGKLLLIEEAGNAVLIDPNPKEYRELARSKISGNTWAHPAISDGVLVIRDQNNVIAVELPK